MGLGGLLLDGKIAGLSAGVDELEGILAEDSGVPTGANVGGELAGVDAGGVAIGGEVVGDRTGGLEEAGGVAAGDWAGGGLAVGVAAGGSVDADGEVAGVTDGGDDEGDFEVDATGGVEEVVGGFPGDRGVADGEDFGDGEGALSAFPEIDTKRNKIKNKMNLLIFFLFSLYMLSLLRLSMVFPY